MPYTKTDEKRIRVDRHFANNALTSQPPAFSTETRVFGRTKTGNYLPSWKKIISAGGNATTVFSGQISDMEVELANSKLTYSVRPSQFHPWEFRYSRESSWRQNANINPLAGHFSSLSAALIAKARAKAVRALYKAIWEADHQMQGGVMIGEAKKTGQMMVKTAGNLKKGVMDYVAKAVGIRQGPGSKKSKRKAISDSYLEAVFGWQPLIMDCKDLAKTLGRLVYENNRVRFRAYGVEEGEHSKAAGTLQFGGLHMINQSNETVKFECLYRGFLQLPKFETGKPPADRIVSMSGFDLRSFVPTLWELTPYSFLVDYFTNIGDCLQAWCSNTSYVKVLWLTEIWESKRCETFNPNPAETHRTYKITYGENVRDIVVSGGVGKYTVTLRNVSRAPATVPFMVPQFTGFDLSVKQFMNIGALITSKTG